MAKAGVYKAIWHNSFSYLKAKTLKYRLRVLEKTESESSESSISQLEELFSVNDLSDREDQTYKALR